MCSRCGNAGTGARPGVGLWRRVDDAVQAHGAGGVSEDFGLASAWAHQRTLRIADGPDEVHARAVARIEFARHAPVPGNDTRTFNSGDVGASR